ncbi:MAG TPA: TlpA disulfide reductase family protein [Dissulfurispiraceae bacterium]|nr:TlpA disulfide reductase family protein [Dissulfurispiraceae bacterium]
MTFPFFAMLSLLFLFSVFLFLPSGVLAGPPSPFDVEKLSGQAAPDFALQDLEGNTVSLSSFKGKVVFLNFWATWCPPCKDELPSIEKLHNLMKQKGLVVLAVSIDKSPEKVRDFLKQHPVSFRVLMDKNASASRSFKVFSLPMTFIIDKRGVLIEKHFGEKDWSKPDAVRSIEALL